MNLFWNYNGIFQLDVASKIKKIEPAELRLRIRNYGQKSGQNGGKIIGHEDISSILRNTTSVQQWFFGM